MEKINIKWVLVIIIVALLAVLAVYYVNSLDSAKAVMDGTLI